MRGQIVTGPRDQSEPGAGSQGHRLNGRRSLLAAALRRRAGEKVCPWAHGNLSESRAPAVTLSFGDAMQLEKLTTVTLMAFKLPLKM